MIRLRHAFVVVLLVATTGVLRPRRAGPLRREAAAGLVEEEADVSEFRAALKRRRLAPRWSDRFGRQSRERCASSSA